MWFKKYEIQKVIVLLRERIRLFNTSNLFVQNKIFKNKKMVKKKWSLNKDLFFILRIVVNFEYFFFLYYHLYS